MKNNKKLLSEIETAINENQSISINNKHELPSDELIVIKRNGSEAKYDVSKMRRVCLWACGDNESFADMLLTSTRIKLYQKIKISDVYDELIKSAANKISRIYPEFELIASKLLLLKIYKESWNIKKTRYPNFAEVVEEGVKRKKYSHDVYDAYSSDEINQIGSFIEQERDFLFTYKSLYIFNEKYCLNSTKKNKLELPQHAYIRIAMCLYKDEPKEIRLSLIKELYDILSQNYITMATPIMLNAGT
ncbi:MAG: ribonucleotide reductase N-terminal alpha domain-containing protein, partial [Mycoplasma sp.]